MISNADLRMFLRPTFQLTLSQIKARYRKTIAGFFWVLVGPILTYAVQATVFKHVLRLELPHYATFLLGGLLPWIFISNSFDMGISAITRSRQLLITFQVDSSVLVAASILDNWINFLFAFGLILIPMCVVGGAFSWGLLLLPVALFTLLLGTAGMVSILALLNVFFRDVAFVVRFGMGVLYFLTPSFYPRFILPDSVQWLVELNPIYHLILPVRECIYQFSWDAFVVAEIKAVIVSVAVLGMATLYWKEKRTELYHSL